MNDTSVKMDIVSGTLLMAIRLWDRTDKKYRWASLTFDTGASVTTISTEILHQLGYEPLKVGKVTITTASDVVRVQKYKLDKMMIGNIEIEDVDIYAHKFPEECFSLGVIGLNVLRSFDIELSFSTQIIRFKKIAM